MSDTLKKSNEWKEAINEMLKTCIISRQELESGEFDSLILGYIVGRSMVKPYGVKVGEFTKQVKVIKKDSAEYKEYKEAIEKANKLMKEQFGIEVDGQVDNKIADMIIMEYSKKSKNVQSVQIYTDSIKIEYTEKE